MIKKITYSLLIIALASTVVAGASAAPAPAKMVPGTVSMDNRLGYGLGMAIRQAGYPGDLTYAVTDITQDPVTGYDVYSVVGGDLSGSWNINDDGLYFFSMVHTPEGFTPTRIRAASWGDSGRAFPWELGKQMFFGSLGVHTGGYGQAGWLAVDFMSGNVYGPQAAPPKAYASISGTIDYVCRDSTSLAIKTGDVLYSHLVDDAGLIVGVSLDQSEYISGIVTGSFTDTCGYAVQNADHYHIHFAFPVDGDGMYYMEDYRLNPTTEIWKNLDGDEVEVGGWLTSTGGGTGGGGGDTGNITNFWDYIISGVDMIATSVVGMLPTHQTIQLSYMVATYASTPVRIFASMAILKFGLVVLLVGIIVFLEIVRALISAWMWIKRAIPVVG